MSIKTIQEPTNAKVDIVFVHGLHDKQGSWTSKSGISWPKEFLSARAPDARILSYEYRVNITSFFNNEDTFETISKRLIQRLMDDRDIKKSGDRPIIFVAHCLGGVLLENALVRAAHDENKSLISCIRGILFLGTPHFKDASWAAARKYFQCAGVPEEEIPIESAFESKSKYLISISQAFADLKKTAEAQFMVERFYALNDTIVDSVLARCPDTPRPRALGYTQLELSQFENENEEDFGDVLLTLTRWLSKIDPPGEMRTGPENQGNVTFAGSPNSGLQLGHNLGSISGLSWGNGR